MRESINNKITIRAILLRLQYFCDKTGKFLLLNIFGSYLDITYNIQYTIAIMHDILIKTKKKMTFYFIIVLHKRNHKPRAK